MQNSRVSKLVLQNRAYLNLRRQRSTLWAVGVMVIGILALTAAVIWYTAAKHPALPGWRQLLDALIQRFSDPDLKTLFALLAVPVALLHGAYIALAMWRERLVLTELGIAYVSPLPAALQFLQASWSLQWSQIRRAEFKQNTIGPHAEFQTLILDTGLMKRSLRPYLWVDPASYSPPPPPRLLQRQERPDAQAVIAQVMESAVMQFMKNLPHIRVALPERTAAPFALEKNPWSLAFIAAFFVFIAYAFVDTFVTGTETYSERPPYEYYAVGGVMMAALGLWLMRRGKVPAGESIVIALLAGAAFGAALYPGLLRLNQWSDVQGLTAHRYVMRRLAYFVPVSKGLPEIRLDHRYHEFWSQYPNGREELFELRRGGLGFYQINMQPLHARMHAYYANKK